MENYAIKLLKEKRETLQQMLDSNVGADSADGNRLRIETVMRITQLNMAILAILAALDKHADLNPAPAPEEPACEHKWLDIEFTNGDIAKRCSLCRKFCPPT